MNGIGRSERPAFQDLASRGRRLGLPLALVLAAASCSVGSDDLFEGAGGAGGAGSGGHGGSGGSSSASGSGGAGSSSSSSSSGSNGGGSSTGAGGNAPDCGKVGDACCGATCGEATVCTAAGCAACGQAGERCCDASTCVEGFCSTIAGEARCLVLGGDLGVPGGMCTFLTPCSAGYKCVDDGELVGCLTCGGFADRCCGNKKCSGPWTCQDSNRCQ